MSKHTADVLCQVAAERERQDRKWGEQNHPDGTGSFSASEDGIRIDATLGEVRRDKAEEAKRACDQAARPAQDGRALGLARRRVAPHALV